MIEKTNLTICTQLLDWNFGLKEALPTWLNFPCDEIVIFDWGNGKESAKEITDQYSDKRVKFIQGLEKIPYNHSIARNTAIRIAKSDLIFFIDADIKILNSIPITSISSNNFMNGPFIKSTTGTAIFWKGHFEKLNGFDERMQGWGCRR